MSVSPPHGDPENQGEGPEARATRCCSAAADVSAPATEAQRDPDQLAELKTLAPSGDDPHDRRLDRQWNRLRRQLPDVASRSLGWLRERRARLVRIPVGILLIAGGFVGFLPVLGFWMVPLGLLLLAQDIPFLKRPTGRALVWFNRTWQRWKRRWRNRNGGEGSPNGTSNTNR